jgi:hypothetical protein
MFLQELPHAPHVPFLRLEMHDREAKRDTAVERRRPESYILLAGKTFTTNLNDSGLTRARTRYWSGYSR